MRGLLWIWVKWIAGLINWGLHSRLDTILGMIPSWFVVLHVRVPGCFSGLPESVRIGGLKGNSFLLPSDQNAGLYPAEVLKGFLLNLHSISWDIREIYCFLIPRTDVFRDWPFVGCFSGDSLKTAANFRSLSPLPFFWMRNYSTVVKIDSLFKF